MATCPDCSTNSRLGGWTLKPILLVGDPVGYGSSPKYAAERAWELRCPCGWYAVGVVDGDDFIFTRIGRGREQEDGTG